MSEHRSPQPRADRTVLPSPTALNSWNAFGLLIRDTIYSMALDALLPHLPSVPPIIQRQSYVVGDSVGSYPALHVICVHGFRGDHTSFRRFPTDLHYSLDDRIPSLHTYIYPTYKSRKPLQVSVERLMTWMDTLEPGYFILVGHSLGGFLVAEAALQYSRRSSKSTIIGFIAMDVPYLGVHPHVIVSGIVSLFPSDKAGQTEQDLNDTSKVHMVEPMADDTSSIVSGSDSPPRDESGRMRFGRMRLPDLTPGPTALQNTIHFFKKHSKDPISAMTEWVVSYWEHGSMLLDPEGLRNRYRQMESWKEGEWVNFYTETVPVGRTPDGSPKSRSPIPSRSRSPTPSHSPSTSISHSHKEDKVPFPQPHLSEGTLGDPFQSLAELNSKPSTSSYTPAANPSLEIRFPEPDPAPFTPLTNEAVEAQFPPSPTPTPSLSELSTDHLPSRSSTTSSTLIMSPQSPRSPTPDHLMPHVHKAATSPLPGKGPATPTSPGTPRRFIILPWDSTPSKSKWERVPVSGVKSEVDAHVGIFFPDKNLDYEQFVQRVSDWVIDTCKKRKPEILAY